VKGSITMAKKILIVDDEPIIVKGLKFNLEQEGYITDSAYDGEEALEKAFTDEFDLILLDVMLPKLSGLEVCQAIREKSNIPIIMLSAKGEDIDRIMGLELGSDDYITKPFNILEVKARIKSLFRRTVSLSDAVKNILSVGDMVVNLDNRSVVIGEVSVSLTAKELDLLKIFITNRGKVYSREQLLEIVWKYDYLGALRTVDVHIRRLREKIEPDPASPVYIHTKWGVGYYFVEE